MRVFGDDIFVSYAHRDAGAYAVALVARLSKRYAVYIDRVGSKPGKQISAKVLRHLNNASMLIVILSSDATRMDSKVRDEVECFIKTGRPILVIDIDNAVERCQWRDSLNGLSYAKEPKDSRLPSVDVRRSVEQARKYWTRTNRLLFIAASIIIATLIVVAAAWRSVDTARREAGRQRTAAAAQRFSNLAMTAWQQEKTPLNDVLVLLAESLRHGSTPAGVQLASLVRAMRSRVVAQYKFDNRKQGGTWLHDGTLFIVDKKSLRLLDIVSRKERSVSLPCDSRFESFVPAAIVLNCEGPSRPYRVDLETLEITNDPAYQHGQATAAGRIADAFKGEPGYTVELRIRGSGQPFDTHPLTFADYVQLLRFSGNGHVLAAVLQQGERGTIVSLVDIVKRQPLGFLTVADTVASVALNDDGSAVALLSRTDEGSLRSTTLHFAVRDQNNQFVPLWHMPLRQYRGFLEFTGGAVAFRDGNVIRIIGAGEHGQPHELRRIVEPDDFYDAAVLASGEIATTTLDRVTIWDPGPIPERGGELRAIDQTAARVAFWRGPMAIVRDLETGRDVFSEELCTDGGEGLPMALDTGGSRLAVAVPGTIDVFDVGPHKPVARRDICSGNVPSALLFAGNGALITAWSRRITVSDARRREIDAFDIPATTFSLASDANATRIAFVSNGRLYLRNTVTHSTTQLQGLPGRARVVWLSSDASLLASADDDGHVELRDLREGVTLFEFEAGSWIADLCVRSDRRRLGVVVGSEIGYRVLLYDLVEKRLTSQISMNEEPAIGFRADGPLAAVGSAGEEIVIDDDAVRVADGICRETGGSLSRKRWAQLVGDEPWADTCGEVRRSLQSASASR